MIEDMTDWKEGKVDLSDIKAHANKGEIEQGYKDTYVYRDMGTYWLIKFIEEVM